MIHEGVRYSCDNCDLITSDKSNLREHQKVVHEGLRYRCDLCGYQAKWRQSLRDHMKSNHKGEIYEKNDKKYSKSKMILKCEECGHVASKADNLRRHIETQHNANINYYNCDFCPYKAKEKGKLSRHQTSRKCLRFQIKRTLKEDSDYTSTQENYTFE